MKLSSVIKIGGTLVLALFFCGAGFAWSAADDPACFQDEESRTAAGQREKAECLLERISELSRTGDLDTASALLEEVSGLVTDLSWQGGMARTEALRGDLLIMQGRYDSAIGILSSAWERYGETEEGLKIGNLLASAFRLQGNYPEATRLYNRLIEEAGKRDDPVLLAGLNQNLAVVYEQIGAFAQALEIYFDSLELAESMNDTLLQVVILNNIGDLYNREEDYDRARNFLLESLELGTQIGSSDDISRAALNLGNCSRGQGNLKEAEAWYEKSLGIATGMGNIIRPVQILYNMGNIYLDQQKTGEARAAFGESLELSREHNIIQGRYYNNLGLGDVYRSTNLHGEAAGRYLEALEVARQLGSLEWERTISDRLQALREEEGDVAGAFEWLKQVRALSDSLQKLNQEEVLARYHVLFDLRSERLQNELLEEKLQAQQMTAIIAVASALAIAFALAALYRLYHRQRKITASHMRQNEELSELYRQVNQQKEELSRINETKDRLFSILAHDLRSPISQLQSLVWLIREDVLDQVNTEEVLQRIERQLNHSIRTLENYLSWAQSQLEGLIPQMEAVSLHDKVEEVAAMMEKEAESKRIGIRNQTGRDKRVLADENMLRILVQNLVSNAVKFSNAGSEILIRDREEGDRVVLSVRDTGVGIAEGKQENLFKAFNPSEKGTGNEKGTGLGLSICREFAEKQGGRIWFESTPGEGTTFHVELNRAEPS